MKSLNMFCLPFAGGSFYAYREFEKYVASDIRVIGTDLPGHGRKIAEPLLTDIHKMADYIWELVRDDLNDSYAIYGHSMGATLAYLLTKKIFQENVPVPRHLFVSGRPGPSGGNEKEEIHQLPKAEFIRKITEYGGTPKEVLAEEELMNFMEPILRADFQAVETYHYAGDTPLDIPVTVMVGSDDRTCQGEAMKWQAITTQEITFREFSGGHFFIFEHLPEIGKIISQALTK